MFFNNFETMGNSIPLESVVNNDNDTKITEQTEQKHDSNSEMLCECGAILRLRKAKNTYKEYSSVICDICNKLLSNTINIYHCPSKYVPNIHPKGWDICEFCVAKLDEKRNQIQYYALIIQAPLLSNGTTCSRDGVLFAQFLQNELKYNDKNIELVKNENVNSHNITLIIEAFKRKLKKGDVITIFFSGHGSLISGQHYFGLHNKELLKSSKFQEIVLQNLHDYNVLFLINTCHSGAFRKYIEDNSEIKCHLCHAKMRRMYTYPCGHFCCGSCCDYRNDAYDKMDAIKCPICQKSTAQEIFSRMNINQKEQNLMAILSCAETQESNFWYPMSPFVKYAIEGLRNKMNTPSKLMHYIQQEYVKPSAEINLSLMDLGQSLNSVSYGRNDFLLSST
eukprot:462213_1